MGGSAVFWYNLFDSSDPDRLTLHGACPVVYGTKWGNWSLFTIPEHKTRHKRNAVNNLKMFQSLQNHYRLCWPYWPLLTLIGPYWPFMALIGLSWPFLALFVPFWPLSALIGPYWPLSALLALLALHGPSWPFLPFMALFALFCPFLPF